MDVVHLNQEDTRYPPALRRYLGDAAPQQVAALGNLDIFVGAKHLSDVADQHLTNASPLLALFCSRQCPRSLILQTYDLAQRWREQGVTVISGFHSPMEQECLTILLRGTQPVIICPARSIHKRIPADWKKPLHEGRALILSPFTEKQRRMTAETAVERNRFVAALADEIFVAHAAPQSQTERFCRDVLTWGKPLYTLDSDANARLIALGARRIMGATVATTT